MLTTVDKTWISKKLETELEKKLKKELKPVRDSIDLLRGKITTSQLQQRNLDARLDALEASDMRAEEKLDKVLSMLDGFAGKVADLETENSMGAVTLRRHDVQIHELATATGTTVTE